MPPAATKYGEVSSAILRNDVVVGLDSVKLIDGVPLTITTWLFPHSLFIASVRWLMSTLTNNEFVQNYTANSLCIMFKHRSYSRFHRAFRRSGCGC